MLDVFKEHKKEGIPCPPMSHHGREEMLSMIDPEIPAEELNNGKRTIVILGYWRVLKEGVAPHFERYYILATKSGDVHFFLQHRKDGDIVYAENWGAEDPEKRVIGGILSKGTLKEEFLDDSQRSRRIRYKMAQQLSFVPSAGETWGDTKTMKIFSIIPSEEC